jgi:hypothetical protein
MSSNIWAKFKALIPTTPRLIGEVNSVLADDRYRVIFPSGEVVEALSSNTYSVGDSVFVEGDKITSRAPDLPSVTIEL